MATGEGRDAGTVVRSKGRAGRDVPEDPLGLGPNGQVGVSQKGEMEKTPRAEHKAEARMLGEPSTGVQQGAAVTGHRATPGGSGHPR